MATRGDAVNAKIHFIRVSSAPSADSSEALGVAGLSEGLEIIYHLSSSVSAPE